MKKILIIILTVVVVLLFTACSDNYVQVRVLTPRGEAVDFSTYDTIYYRDLVINKPPKGYDPVKELNIFFLEDIPRIIEKKVIHVKQTDKIDTSAKSLIITGNLTFDVKIRNKIKEVKGETGKKEKKFMPVHHWTLTLEVIMKDGATGKDIFVKKYSDKMMDADISDSKYNFETLFFKINNRFGREITTIKKMQRRYLLTR